MKDRRVSEMRFRKHTPDGHQFFLLDVGVDTRISLHVLEGTKVKCTEKKDRSEEKAHDKYCIASVLFFLFSFVTSISPMYTTLPTVSIGALFSSIHASSLSYRQANKETMFLLSCDRMVESGE
jgi:hypothetical protein